MILLTLMPISVAAPLSSLTASIALPVLVKLMKSVRPIMMTAPTISVTNAAVGIPAALRNGSSGSFQPTEPSTGRGAEPKTNNAMLCKR